MNPFAQVLLVEDNQTTTFLHQRLLRRLGVAQQVVAVADGSQALVYLASCDAAAGNPYPTLILLDLRMPLLDGWGFLAAYRQLPLPQQQAPVIVLTVPVLSITDLQRLQPLVVAGILYKPLTAEKVEQMLAILGPTSPTSSKDKTGKQLLPVLIA
jgi:CheY-like chemotaxis protein